jgi:PhoPQ-activated pathogenicity-related protein
MNHNMMNGFIMKRVCSSLARLKVGAHLPSSDKRHGRISIFCVTAHTIRSIWCAQSHKKFRSVRAVRPMTAGVRLPLDGLHRQSLELRSKYFRESQRGASCLSNTQKENG